MPLPITKGEFNRLGDRLIAHENPSEADLAVLATALAAYQEVLGQVKVHLRDLGFAPTTRPKTTPTITDKLRRTHGMELSRIQDQGPGKVDVTVGDWRGGRMLTRRGMRNGTNAESAADCGVSFRR